MTHRLTALGITAREVRAWGLAAGVTTKTVGRLSADLLDEYEQAHA